jgi:hypothetical protein
MRAKRAASACRALLDGGLSGVWIVCLLTGSCHLGGGVVASGVAGAAAVAAVTLGGAWGPLVQATSYCDLGL